MKTTSGKGVKALIKAFISRVKSMEITRYPFFKRAFSIPLPLVKETSRSPFQLPIKRATVLGFEAFEEVGDPFDESLAKSLEANILSAGGSKDAEDLYVAFRGRLPGVEALLKGRGLYRVA